MTETCTRLGQGALSHGVDAVSELPVDATTMARRVVLVLASTLAFFSWLVPAKTQDQAPNLPAALQQTSREPIEPVPLSNDLDQNKVALGRRLFNDSRLSGGNGVSCTSCHAINQGMTDHLKLSRGLPGYPGITNTLGLFNVGLNAKFSWAGGITTLEDHTDRVIENKLTMGGRWDDVLETLRGDPSMVAAFEALYPDGIQRRNVIDAIVLLEMSLNTPNAPFDRYLRGDKAAISPQAEAGYRLFKDYGCVSCHQGINVGGNMLQVFGIFKAPDGSSEGISVPGSAADSGIAGDRPVFRVPSLRNVAHTAPYFHNGSATTLRQAIDTMAVVQLGRNLAEDDVAKLEAFLRSLTGEYEGVSLDKM